MKTPSFWKHRGLAALTLKPVARGYDFFRRRTMHGLAALHASVPVICVGNVVAGGAGKTPLALKLAEILQAKGWMPHFSSRGYGGLHKDAPVKIEKSVTCRAEQMGDEPLLLAAHAPCWVGRDRLAAAKLAAAYGADCVIMDDGLQHASLYKNISLLVIDGAYGIGNGLLLPAGPLREPLEEALKRVQAVVMIGEDAQELKKTFSPDMPVFHATLEPERESAARIKGRRVVGFAGIGRPEKFLDTLEKIGADVVAFNPFADHHRYSASELKRLRAEAAFREAALVTTEKDYVRLDPQERKDLLVLPVTLQFAEEAAFTSWLMEHLPRAREAA